MTATLPKTTDPSLVVLGSETTASVERSTEFLSCARTALKIAKRKHQNDPNPPPPNAWWLASPADLQLLDPASVPPNTRTKEILQDGLDLLQTMESELKQLETLVRRRGQTNDPTQAIAASTQRLEQDTKELTAWLPTIVPPTVRRNSQAFKHYSMIQEWFQQTANAHAKRLQEILKVRGKVLTEQARRRKLFQATSESRTGSTRKPVAAVHNNPLFQLEKPVAKVAPKSNGTTTTTTTTSTHTNGGGYGKASSFPSAPTNGSMNGAAAATAPTSVGPQASLSKKGLSRPAAPGGYAYYPAKQPQPSPYASSMGGGYGGGSSGMRQRRAAATTDTNSAQQQQQEQALLLQRQQERESRQRLREAQEAEKGLASLVGLFGKMTTLISEQSEQIDKIEDDVEAASADVEAGQNSIQQVYSLKKGNRPLIIRTFAVLNFVIIFMRFYRGKG